MELYNNENKMKQIQIQAIFQLPDDFNGTIPEALRLMAGYLEDDSKKPLNKKDEKVSEACRIGWVANFRSWEKTCKEGGKFDGLLTLSELSPLGDKWIKMNPGIKMHKDEGEDETETK